MPTRVRWTVAAALVLSAVAALAALDWPGQHFRHGDFMQYWLGGRALLEGRDPYDPVVWRELHDRAGSGGGEVVPGLGFFYPLTTAVAALPIAVLPQPAAAAAWFVAQTTSTLAILVALGRRLFVVAPGRDLAVLLVFAAVTQPAYLLAGQGNIARFLPAIAGGALLLLLASRPFAAGLVLGLAVVKPQIFLLFAPALLVLAERGARLRVVAGAAAAGVGLLAVSVALRPDWIGAWLGQTAHIQGAFGRTNLAGVFAPDRQWQAVPIAIALVALLLVWWRARRPPPALAASAALALSLFLAPYAAPYDQAVLLVAVTALLATIAPLPVLPRALFVVAALVTSSALGLLSVAELIPPGPELLVPAPALFALLLAADLAARRRIVVA